MTSFEQKHIDRIFRNRQTIKFRFVQIMRSVIQDLTDEDFAPLEQRSWQFTPEVIANEIIMAMIERNGEVLIEDIDRITESSKEALRRESYRTWSDEKGAILEKIVKSIDNKYGIDTPPIPFTNWQWKIFVSSYKNNFHAHFAGDGTQKTRSVIITDEVIASLSFLFYELVTNDERFEIFKEERKYSN